MNWIKENGNPLPSYQPGRVLTKATRWPYCKRSLLWNILDKDKPLLSFDYWSQKMTGSSICRPRMKSFSAILIGPIQYIEIPLRTAFFFDDCWNFYGWSARDWIIVQLLLAKNQVDMISLAAILEGQRKAQAIDVNIWIQRQQIDGSFESLFWGQCSYQGESYWSLFFFVRGNL